MKFFQTILIFFAITNLYSQEAPNFTAVDSLYREDQFYVGVTYNALQKRPTGIAQKRFTPSFSFGFLRDMPVNKSRTVAIALGLGYSINNYNENLEIQPSTSSPSYEVIGSTVNYDRNKLYLHYVDLPIEFRWRTSTPESHKFWRIYSGFKVSYLVYDKSKYVDPVNTIKVTSNPDFNKIQYGTYLSVGYNTWTFNIYYGLNSIFQSGEINSNPIVMKTVNFGLMFYIL